MTQQVCGTSLLKRQTPGSPPFAFRPNLRNASSKKAARHVAGSRSDVPWEICDWDLQNLQTVRKHQFRVVRAGAVVVAAAGRVAGRACWALAG